VLSYRRLSKTPSVFRSFTGLEVNEFDSILEKVEGSYPSLEEKRLSRKGRKRGIGAGHPFKLSIRDRLLMLLVYYRLYVTSTLTGYLFDLGQTNVLKDIRILEPVVSESVPLPKKVYREIKRRLRTIEEVEEFFPGFKAYIDSTEQEIPRPKKDKQKRKTHYSGKKRRHTVKTQLTVNGNGLIVQRTDHARGRTHDYSLFKRNRPHLPENVRPVVDLGYYGIEGDYPELNPMIPFKRHGGGPGHGGEKARELTTEQKAFNTQLSRHRVVVEHTISRMKKFRVMADEFRNRLRHYDTMTDIVSGLINLRILGTMNA
jgi:DDE superfamily endonuclease